MPTHRLHVFTSSANLVISSITGNPDTDTVEYLIVGGGGGAGAFQITNPSIGVRAGGSGGGAGGFRTGNVILSESNVATYTITVGAGGASNINGESSTFLNITSLGGGAGWGVPGGSGGGGLYNVNGAAIPGGSGTPGQGNAGGSTNIPGPAVGYTTGGNGGGGAGGSGNPAPRNFPGSVDRGANGGIGASVTWVPASYGTTGPAPGRWFGGGGSGGGYTQFAFPDPAGYYGGAGGGGNSLGFDAPVPARAGTTNTGGGGAGSGTNNNPNGVHPGGTGGSGIVIVRYPLLDIASTVQSKVSRVSNIEANVSTATSFETIQFTVNMVNASNGEILYYSTNNQPNAAFTTGNTGSFTVNGNVGYVTLSITSSANDEQYTDLQVRRNSPVGPILRQGGNVFIDIPQYIEATGGTIIDSDGYRIHVFTSTANLNVTALPAESSNAEVILIGGGGGGGSSARSIGASGEGIAGGGGAGGLLRTNIILAASNYVITIGAGGLGAPKTSLTETGYNGANTIAFGLTALGGGGGGSSHYSGDGTPPPVGTLNGRPGGSGGGAGGWFSPGRGIGSAGTSISGQGNNGGSAQNNPNPGYPSAGGGGGGAGGVGGTAFQRSVGSPSPAPMGQGGTGGTGIAIPWIPAAYGAGGPTPGRWFAGGGGGGTEVRPYLGPGSLADMAPPTTLWPQQGGLPGIGGGGQGSQRITPTPTAQFWYYANTKIYATAGNVNTGGGGGAGAANNQPPSIDTYGAGPGKSGGSGIVIIRYPYNP